MDPKSGDGVRTILSLLSSPVPIEERMKHAIALSQLLRDSYELRCGIDLNFFRIIRSVMSECIGALQQQTLLGSVFTLHTSVIHLSFLTELLRCLRNVYGCKRDSVEADEFQILDLTVAFSDYLCDQQCQTRNEEGRTPLYVLLRCMIQYWCNLVQSLEDKLTSQCFPILYSSLRFNIVFSHFDFQEIFSFLVHLLLKVDPSLLLRVYNDDTNRIYLNSLLEAILISTKTELHPDRLLMLHLVNCFLESTRRIIQNEDDLNVPNTGRISNKMAELVGIFSGNPEEFELPAGSELLAATCSLLRKVHSPNHASGKAYQDFITAVSNLEDHPLRGLKRNLVRIIGNVCSQQRNNQDVVRENGILPILLECTNLDPLNPFIPQWTILALRNLCQDNPQNQQVIAELKRLGVVEDSTLTELGFSIKEFEGKLRISSDKSGDDR